MKAIENKVEASKFVFIGTVKKIGASNLAGLPANDRLILVEINKVAHAPSAFQGVVGTTVTVKIPARTKLESGETRLFFTNRLMYGENLAVEATAIDKVENYEQASKEVKDAVANIERKAQLRRIAEASLVVEGKVTKMEESIYNKKYPLSFKSPHWISVLIDISRVIKGKYGSKTIEVFINKGGEIEAATPLEIQIGKTGVWLLRREAIFKDLKIRNEFYVIEEPGDFLNSYEYVLLTKPTLS